MIAKDKMITLLTIAMLAVGMLVVGMPVLQVSGYGAELSYGFAEMEGWNCIPFAIRVLNGISIAALVLSLLGKVEKTGIWYIPAYVAGVLSLLAATILLLTKDKLVESIGIVLDMLSVKLNATGTMWVYALSSVVMMACTVMLLMAGPQTKKE